MSNIAVPTSIKSVLLRHTRGRSNPIEFEGVTDSSESRSMMKGNEFSHMKVGTSPKYGSVSTASVPFNFIGRVQTVLFISWGFICCKVAKDSVLRMDAKLRDNFFYEAFLYYNPLFMVAMMVWLWGVNVWVFLQSRVNFAKVFDLDQNHLTPREIWKIASWMTILVLTSMTAYLYLYSHGEVSLAASQPVLLYCTLPLLLVFPFDVLYASSRFFFIRTLIRLTIPLQPITFADFFVADVLTSMAKVISDIERSTCRMYNRQVATIAWFEADDICGSHSIWIPCFLAFPYFCRFLQCLRQYYDTREMTSLSNALKYATSFPVIFLSALKYHVLPEMWHGVYRPLWLLCSVINSCFSFYWDVSRDWDLGFFSGSFKSRNPLLRTNLLYNNKWVYYWAISSNLLLRCAWTYKLSAHLRHNYLTVFTFSGLEMLRRFQWIFFRVENEYNKMLTRTSLQVPMKEMTIEAERLLSPSHHVV
ncbi:hypothetical protein O6H91_14G080300 [Diphasiastrum complanatum]|uniref:Uncharacterized protein n=3 Tax=Diphasiastrum complanatum TaxID=34168 RepID=A0ACC2BR63_DIPCM|nr:hypothetical protein O6H91_14G080300 [Diphasiastrum complanatum]KAJ7532270.1 hypothetical protein O6H91_14G080300 [Diphasiastrum complanatum]KAJ7532271.1 hypothetical protein O6H91_14G080300 [Diphasiastrum complanatum]